MKPSRLIFILFCLIFLFFIGCTVSVLPATTILILLICLISSTLTIINLEIGLFLLIFIVPFTQQITLGKLARFPVDIGTDDLLIIFILLSWLAGLARRKEPLFLKTSLNWPIVSFFAVAAFSCIAIPSRYEEQVVFIGILHLFKFFEYVAIYFIVISAVNNLAQIKKFLLMFFITIGFVVIVQYIVMFQYGFFSLTGHQFIKLQVPGFYVKFMRSFQSNGILGAYYAFFLSILLAIILNMRYLKNRVYLIFAALALSFALFNTFSRSAYVGILVSFLILAIFKERRLFLVTLLLLVLSPIYMQSAVQERIILTIQATTPRLVLDPSAAIRLELWQRALKIFADNPLFGVGYWASRYIIGTEAHSQFLTLLDEIGIVGFSMFCWLVIEMLKNGINLMKNAKDEFLKSLGLGYVAGLFAILATCFFVENLEAFRIIGPLWFITGLITSANRLLLLKKTESLNIDTT